MITGLYTKDQMEKVIHAWGVKVKLPKKNEKIVVCFPPSCDFRLATITVSASKSTYGKTLFKSVLSP